MKKVFELKEKILHRDISVGNVMIGEVEGELVGLLCDWDHATETVPDADYKHQTYRTVRQIVHLYFVFIHGTHYLRHRAPGRSCRSRC